MSYQKCKVLCKELNGDPRRIYETQDSIRYREKALRHKLPEAADIVEYIQRVRVKIENNLFLGLDRVYPADLHKPHLLHNIYLPSRLFKHMIEWVKGFHKKNKRQLAFDNSGTEIPLYPRLSVAKKAYPEIRQWQAKGISNLSCSISAVLASIL